jgi:hypothetical protein
LSGGLIPAGKIKSNTCCAREISSPRFARQKNEAFGKEEGFVFAYTAEILVSAVKPEGHRRFLQLFQSGGLYAADQAVSSRLHLWRELTDQVSFQTMLLHLVDDLIFALTTGLPFALGVSHLCTPELVKVGGLIIRIRHKSPLYVLNEVSSAAPAPVE